jgi:hypothetical protein
VADQVELLLEAYPVGAIKTGMLFSLGQSLQWTSPDESVIHMLNQGTSLQCRWQNRCPIVFISRPLICTAIIAPLENPPYLSSWQNGKKNHQSYQKRSIA